MNPKNDLPFHFSFDPDFGQAQHAVELLAKWLRSTDRCFAVPANAKAMLRLSADFYPTQVTRDAIEAWIAELAQEADWTYAAKTKDGYEDRPLDAGFLRSPKGALIVKIALERLTEQLDALRGVWRNLTTEPVGFKPVFNEDGQKEAGYFAACRLRTDDVSTPSSIEEALGLWEEFLEPHAENIRLKCSWSTDTMSGRDAYSAFMFTAAMSYVLKLDLETSPFMVVMTEGLRDQVQVGKSYALKALSVVATGGPGFDGEPPPNAIGDDTEFQRMCLVPAAHEQWTTVLFDNIKRPIANGLLEALVTGQASVPRLHSNESTKVSGLLVFGTANNPSYSDDMARRSIQLRFEGPKDATGFVYEGDLVADCAANAPRLRGILVALGRFCRETLRGLPPGQKPFGIGPSFDRLVVGPCRRLLGVDLNAMKGRGGRSHDSDRDALFLDRILDACQGRVDDSSKAKFYGCAGEHADCGYFSPDASARWILEQAQLLGVASPSFKDHGRWVKELLPKSIPNGYEVQERDSHGGRFRKRCGTTNAVAAWRIVRHPAGLENSAAPPVEPWQIETRPRTGDDDKVPF